MLLDAENINRLGLAAQFFSFWLLTPEVLSPAALHKLQVALRKGLLLVGGSGPVGMALVGFACTAICVAVSAVGPGTPGGVFRIGLIVTGLAVALWIVVELVFLLAAAMLEATERWKSRFAYAGALLFVGGTAAQFAATYGQVL